MRKQILLTDEICNALISLMDNGFSFKEAMCLIDAKSRNPAFRSIQTRLEHGEVLAEFFSAYLPKAYQAYFTGFIQYMPFLESLSLSRKIIEGERQERTAIVKGMLYPIVLLCGVLAGIMLFNSAVLPKMLSLMKEFGLSIDHYEQTAQFIRMSTLVFASFFAIAIVVVLSALSKNCIVTTYRLISSRIPDSILVQSASSDFARFFLECVKMNISTRESLEILMRIQTKPLVALIAAELDHAFNQGTAMEQAIQSVYVEEALSKLFRIAYYASECQSMLEGYLKMVKDRNQLRIRKFTRVVQLFAYGTIGLLLVFVYEILMLPMTMIQNM